jgi:hypothetical protein
MILERDNLVTVGCPGFERQGREIDMLAVSVAEA